MICGIGIDAASIERAGRLDRHAVEKIFHPLEVERYSALENAAQSVRSQFLASRFAVKEAYAKARGTGFCENVIPCEICTTEDENGKPEVHLYGRTAQHHPANQIIHVTITHQKPLALAVVILEQEGGHEQS